MSSISWSIEVIEIMTLLICIIKQDYIISLNSYSLIHNEFLLIIYLKNSFFFNIIVKIIFFLK